jgi:hypothetical protein
MTPTPRKRALVLLVLGAILLLGVGIHKVLAGDGAIAVDKTPGGDFDQARVRTKVFIDFPRSQDMRDKFETQVKVANKLVCDYTDGRYRLENFEIVRHPAEKKNADIWWFNFADRANADLGAFGHGAAAGSKCGAIDTMRTDVGRLAIYSFDTNNDGAPDVPQAGATLAHEMGHLIFGLGDQYTNQRGLDGNAPWAASIDGSPRVTEVQTGLSLYRPLNNGGLEFKDALAYSPAPLNKGGTALYAASAGLPWWLQNNTIMQQAEGQVCAKVDADLNLDGRSKRNEDAPLYFSRGCNSDADCPLGYLCFRAGSPVAPAKADFNLVAAPLSSELTVADNYDRDRFNMTLGTAIPVAQLGNGGGHIQAAGHLVIQGALWPSIESQPALAGGGVVADSPCPDHGPPPAGGTIGACQCPITSSAEEGTFGVTGKGDDFPGGEIFASSADINTFAKCPYEDRPGVPPPTAFGHAISFACLRVDTASCPARLGTTKKAGGAAFCGDGKVAIDEATNTFEQCDNGNGGSNSVNPNVPLQDGGKPLTCAALWSERIARLHGGTHLPIQPTRLIGGNVFCSRNCNYDLSRCGVALADQLDQGKDMALQLLELRKQSQGWAAAEVFDTQGKICAAADKDKQCKLPDLTLTPNPSFPEGSGVNLGEIGPSNHIVFTSLRRTGRYAANGFAAAAPDWRDVWELDAVMDAGEFGGTPGVVQKVRTLELEFKVNLDPACVAANCGPLVKVNGIDFAPTDDQTTWPRAFIGFADAQDDGPFGTQPPTGEFKRGETPPAPGLALRLDLRNLVVQRLKDENGNLYGGGGSLDLRNGVLNSYARSGTKQLVAGGPFFEIPQYGDIKWRIGDANVVKYYDLLGFNTETQRYDTARATLDLLGRGFFGAAPSPGYGQQDQLSDADLKAQANTFIDSDWLRMDKTMCGKWGFHAGPVPVTASSLIHGAPPDARCPDPTVDWKNDSVTPVDFNQDTQVVFVLDRSGSMGTKASSAGAFSGSRLDYVKAAGHVFAETMVANMKAKGAAFGPKIGLVYYSDDPLIKIGVGDPNTTCSDKDVSQCNDPTKYTGKCLEGRCKTFLPVLSDTEGDGKITVTDLKTAHMVIGSQGIDPVPTASGWTASGPGLQKAIQLFDPKRPGGPEPTKILIFLTDGQHNRPAGGKCRDGSLPYRDDAKCWPGANAEGAFQKALTDIQNAGILIYDIPLNNELDPATASIRAGTANGEVFQTSSPLSEDAIPAFFAATAATFGQQVVRSGNSLPNEFSPTSEYETPMVTYFIDVEPGSQALKLLLSDYDSSKDPFDLTDVEVIPPSGPSRFFDVAHPSVEQPVDQFSGAMFISNPQPGRWRVRHAVPDARPLFFVSAHVDNPANNCYAMVNNTTVAPGGTAMITVQAVSDRPVVRGATVTGKLLRADKILVNLTFQQDTRNPALFKALVKPEDLVGRGQYIATVKCDVAADADLATGETLPNGTEPGAIAPRKSGGFHREADVTFFLDSPTIVVPGSGTTQPPDGIDHLPPHFAPVDRHIGDADGDCIPDNLEPPLSVDSDGDGRPDIVDSDANGNNIPDCVDPAICKSGSCLVAEAGPNLFLECTSNAATGTFDGRASHSSDGGPLAFHWTAPVSLSNATTAQPTGTFPNAATTTATLTVTDSHGSATDSADATVMDLTPPTLGTVSDVTTTSCTVPTLATPSTSDSCGGAVTLIRDPAVGFKFPVGTTTVTWFALDRFGNVATRTQKVTVNLSTAPTLTQPANKTFSTCTVSSIGTASAKDACGVTLVPTSNAPAVFPVGTTTVTWTATDNANRSVSKSQTVTITLSTTPKPTVVPPPNITTDSCQVPRLGTATGADACGAPVAITSNAPAVFPVGTTTVTWTAKDSKGQTSSKPQLVTVTLPAGGPPVLTVPAAVTTTTCSSPSLGTASAVDACGVSVPVTRVVPAKLPLGVTTVLWTATDGAGQSSSKTQTVTAELGDDTSCCPAGTHIIKGTSGSDVLVGTSGSDCILGLAGDDVIVGNDGADFISGGAGSDNIDAGNGNDRVWGGSGQNVIHGGAGDDLLYGGAESDNISGGAGNDWLEGRDGADNCSGDDGDDIVFGGNGDDVVSGGNGDDQLLGEAGNDQLQGGPDIDTLDGGGGTDTCAVDPADSRISCER